MQGQRGDMLSRQSELPKLPVPPLTETVDKYLRSVRPFLDDAEMAITMELADELVAPGGVGEQLHTMLQERAASTDNWLSQWWLESAYLCCRDPLVVNSSPAMAMPRQNFKDSKDQLAYAASLITAVLDFKVRIDNETLPTEVQGRNALDMMQYLNIFGSHREPHVPLDKQFFARNSRHIVVAHRGNFYKLKVYAQGEQLRTEQLLKQLRDIVKKSRKKSRCPQIGVLTTRHRDLWAESFALLTSLQGNRQSYEAVRDAIFVLCIDDPLGEKIPWDSISAKQLLAGGKNGENAGNRWCDKTLQFIVGAEGNVGILYEHSPAEGPPVAALCDFIVNHASIGLDPPVRSPRRPEALVFTTNTQIDLDIESARAELKTLIDNLEVSLYTYGSYGKDFIKSRNLSPDGFIQMAFQLAFYRIHNAPGACYETATLRRFLGGRTEAIRSCSEESLHFCETFLSDNASLREKSESLRDAVAAHKNYTNSALAGQGVDRLFFGMKRIASEAGIEIPDFFLDKGMVVSTHFKLSTSQVVAKSRSVMFYGPSVPDGYGCCYNPSDNYINFGLSGYKDCPTTNLGNFRHSLRRSFDEMRNSLLAGERESR